MTAQLIIAIAQLCLIAAPSSQRVESVKDEQLKCQQYYIKCINSKHSLGVEVDALALCIVEKE